MEMFSFTPFLLLFRFVGIAKVLLQQIIRLKDIRFLKAYLHIFIDEVNISLLNWCSVC